MSRVTNVIITGSGAEWEKEIAALNQASAWNEDGTSFQQVEVSCTAGTKRLEVLVLVGAFNYLDMDDLIESMRKVRWQYPESVQLFVCGEDDQRFSERAWAL